MTTALAPVLSQVVGLPDAPVRVTQAPTPASLGNGNTISPAGSPVSGHPPVLRLHLFGAGISTAEFISLVRLQAATAIVDSVTGGGPAGHGNGAQQAVAAALLKAGGVLLAGPGLRVPGPAPGTPAYAAAERFAALPAAARHAWLTAHQAALRAGHMTLAELHDCRARRPPGPPVPGQPPRTDLPAGPGGRRGAPADRAALDSSSRPRLRAAPADHRGRRGRSDRRDHPQPVWRARTCHRPLAAFLRLGTTVALSGTAAAALAAGSAAAHLACGTLGILRDTAGFIGIALLAAALLGGALAWAGPLAYLVASLQAVSAAWTTPWTWPARPPHDLGAALCAALVFATGTIVIALRGPRDSARE